MNSLKQRRVEPIIDKYADRARSARKRRRAEVQSLRDKVQHMQPANIRRPKRCSIVFMGTKDGDLHGGLLSGTPAPGSLMAQRDRGEAHDGNRSLFPTASDAGNPSLCAA
jgi:hypothetical protein